MSSGAKKVPECIGIILDGNRRWARERGLPTLVGHKKGFEKLIEVVRWVRDAGVKHLAVYAFSTENWNRSKEEVSYLMELYLKMAQTQTRELAKEGARVRFIGELHRFSPEIQKSIAETHVMSESNSDFTVWVCLSYGGRAEIVAAAQALQKEGKEITEESLHDAMWSAEMPDPDIIIRTSGEHRLSGFLTWGSIYSELFFVAPHWPAFSKEDLQTVLKEYNERERRHGK